ncbi:MAG TPA: hypothetical protein VHM19_01545 [Polyangiales bacterium]|jgi:hypothetical protein|nr:hypothetical protein [Polyangiales bacterium]
MTPGRKRLLSACFACFLAAHAFEIVTAQEHWPLSNYPMYCEITPSFVVRKEIVGVTMDGKEIPFDIRHHLSPFDITRLYSALSAVKRARGDAAYQHALHALLVRYQWLEAHDQHAGPPLRALRAYQSRWKIEPYAANRDHPSSRKRLFEVRLDEPQRPHEAAP